MKKIICVSFVVLMVAGTSFAAALNPTPPKGFTQSHNVDFAYGAGANSATSINDRYSISTKHKSGDKIYGTTSASGTIYSSTVDPSTAFTASNNPDIPATSTDSTVAGGIGGWTAM